MNNLKNMHSIYAHCAAASYFHYDRCHHQAKHPDISYADLYTLAGVVAVEEAGYE
jgi:hypothetical protein